MKKLMTITCILSLGGSAIAAQGFPPLSRWECNIHNQTSETIHYASQLWTGDVAPNQSKALSYAGINPPGNMPMLIAGCKVVYERNGDSPGTDVNCHVHNDDITIEPDQQ